MNFIYQKNIFLALFAMLISCTTYAASPGGGPPPPTPPPPPGLPIDGSILALFFIAILYAIYFFRKLKINVK